MDLALTTNGVLLAEHAAALRQAGLHRLTVSLDTLDAERFRSLTRMDDLRRVLAGIDAARTAGFPLKLDTVVMRGVNDDELIALLEYAKGIGAEIRFIEYMDVGGATRWTRSAVVPRREILQRLAAHYGAAALPLDERTSAPADRFLLPDGTTFGIISSTTEPFCATCDRSRLTADGVWLMCLYATTGTDLRRPLRAGATREELERLIEAAWSVRADRGAEERLGMDRETTLIPLRSLKKDAHLEMHTRGG